MIDNKNGETAGPLELAVHRKDGSKVLVETRSYPVEIGGQTVVLGIARDITERKKAEEAVRKERDKAQKYLDIAGVIFVVLDAKGKVTLINKKGCEVLGYKEEEIIGKNWFDNFLPEEIKDNVAKVFNKLIAGEIEPAEYNENPVITKSGEERIIAWHNTVLRNEQGAITATLTSGQDITERKLADEFLRVSREKIQKQNEFLNNVLESLTYPFLVIDTDNYKVKIANAAARVAMLSKEMTCYMLSHKLDRPCDESGCSCPLNEIKKYGHAMTTEHVHPDRNGNPQHVEVHSYPILDDKGKVTDIIEYCVDITKRRRAEKALEENECRFRATFEQAAVGVAHVAPDGRFIRVNQRICDITGYTREEMLECTFQDITHPDDLDADLDYVGQVLADEISTYSMEKRYIRKDGSFVWINLTVSLLRDDSGEPKFFISVIEDITERKLTEEKLQIYQEQLRSLASELALAEERERRRIAAELHDQISQTLALSKMNLQSLGKSAGFTDNSMFNDIVESITNTIEQVQHLTFDLSSPTLYKFGLEKAIDELLHDQLHKTGVTYEFTYDKSSKPLDEDIMVILFQSVRELLINIIKHARAQRITVAIQRDFDNITITVDDDGVGFKAN
jgi:PAS domain S-box-containing protein